ncbi:MAG: RNA polymerase sigma factor [Thermoguttaceae bacterium]
MVTLATTNRVAKFSPVVLESRATDEQLLISYRERNDREAFETLVSRYQQELCGYLYHTLGDHSLADDAFQRTFLKVHTNCEKFDAKLSFRPWLYQIAQNTARDWQRYSRRRPSISLDTSRDNTDNSGSYAGEIEGREGDPSERLLSEEMASKARAALEQLTDVQRQTIILIYFQGMTYNEAAAAMNTNSHTIKSRLSTAIRRLNEILSAPEADDFKKAA